MEDLLDQMSLVLAQCRFYALHQNEGLIARARALNPRLFFLNNSDVLQLLGKNLSSLEEVNNGTTTKPLLPRPLTTVSTAEYSTLHSAHDVFVLSFRRVGVASAAGSVRSRDRRAREHRSGNGHRAKYGRRVVRERARRRRGGRRQIGRAHV